MAISSKSIVWVVRMAKEMTAKGIDKEEERVNGDEC